MIPVSAFSIPIKIFKRVVLPHPEAPNIEINSPSLISKEISSKIICPLNFLLMLITYNLNYIQNYFTNSFNI